MLAAAHEHLFQSTLVSVITFYHIEMGKASPDFQAEETEVKVPQQVSGSGRLRTTFSRLLVLCSFGKRQDECQLAKQKNHPQPGISCCTAHTHGGSFCYVDAVFVQPDEAGPRSDLLAQPPLPF